MKKYFKKIGKSVTFAILIPAMLLMAALIFGVFGIVGIVSSLFGFSLYDDIEEQKIKRKILTE